MSRVKGFVVILAKLMVILIILGTRFQGVSTEEEEPQAIKERAAEDPILKEEKVDRQTVGADETTKLASAEYLKMYKRLFRRKREAHFEAIDTLLKLGKYEKQHKMISILLEKLFKTMGDSQVKLMSLGYTLGDPFPANETTRDAYSNVIENTAFCGDMLLRFPDIVHDVMKRNREWDLLLKWGVTFCHMSNALESKELKLLNLMSQELGLIEKDENYVNPYKEENIKMSMQMKQEADDTVRQRKKKTEKKKKKDKKRGPRLSGEL